MSMFFNEIEAARIAQTMETNGLAFYQRAAAKTKTADVRGLFLQLADDEKKHLATFEELEGLLRKRGTATAVDDEAELAAYIDKLLQTQVFGSKGDVARLCDEAASDAEAMAVGMKAERDSILFYQEMLDFVGSIEARDAFSWIVKEERQHLRTLGERSARCAE